MPQDQPDQLGTGHRRSIDEARARPEVVALGGAGGNGESQLGGLRLVDLGVFDSSVNGIETAYTPAGGETVLAVLLADAEGANRQTLVFGSDEMIAGVQESNNLGGSPRPLAVIADPTSAVDSLGGLTSGTPKALALVSTPVRVGIFVSPGFIEGDRGWQADHVYPAGSYVVALVDQGEGPVPTIYHTAAGGTSGLVEPVWTVNPVDTVDGTVTWHDTDILDETLSCHAYALVAELGGGGGNGGSQPQVKQAFFVAAAGNNPVSVPPGADTAGTWAKVVGEDVVDLTDPAHPVALADGRYTFNGTLAYLDAPQAGKYMQCSAESDTEDFGTGGNITRELNIPQSIGGTLVRVGFDEYLVAGQKIGYFIKHDAAGALDFYMNGMLVYMPCTGNSIV